MNRYANAPIVATICAFAATCAGAPPEPVAPSVYAIPPATSPTVTTPLAERPVVGRAPYAPEVLDDDDDDDDAASNPGSVVFDVPRGRRIELDQQTRIYTRIDVFGSRERPPPRVKSFEQRFNEALNPHASPYYPRDWGANAKPCSALASPGTGIGTTFNVYGFCP